MGATELPSGAGVVVIGGGVMGVSTAYHLAAKGARDVILVEREPFLGAMSTGQCAGGIRHQFASETNVRLSIESIRMLERFPEELGQDIGLRFDGYLFLLESEDDATTFRRAVALQNGLGVRTRWLEPEELASVLPQLDLEGVIGATFNDRDGLCDPSSVVQGYAAGARRLGVRLFPGTEVTGIDVERGRVTGVRTTAGRVAAPVVVNTAGAWAPQVGAMARVDIPLQPIRRQIAATGPVAGVGDDFPFVIFFRDSLYFHREGPGLLTGMSNPNEEPGYRLDVDPAWEEVHLERALRRLPALGDAEIRSRWAGLYEVTPDAHPILGAVPHVEGFYVMAGFSGHGFMHGPMAGLLMAEEILDGRACSIDVSTFRYERFLSGALNPEYAVI